MEPEGVKTLSRSRSKASRGRRRQQGPGAATAGENSLSNPAYIQRKLPCYAPFDEEALTAIENTADDILAEVGIEFWDDDEALDLWRKAGATVDGVRVRFDRGLVRSIVQKTAPREFVQHARNPKNSVTIGNDNLVLVPAYGSPFVRDLDGGRRYATLDDFQNLVKLSYSSPWLHHSGGVTCEPVDIPVNKRHLDMILAHIRYSDRPFLGSITAPERAQDSIEMARLLFGAEFLENNCVVMGNINANSPLVFDGSMTGALKAYSAANQGMVIVPFILGGAMGPATMAGAVAQALAEGMVGVALTQLVRPGAPAIFGNFVSSMSLKSGAPTFGMPEPALGTYAIGQLARRLGVPLRTGGSFTSSKVADAQAAQESADSLMPALLSGANFILHSAGWLEGGLTIGYEKLLLDCDHLGMMHTFLQGMPVDANSLAMDAFREAGPGKHFLGTQHTMENFRSAYFDSDLADSGAFEHWQDAGSKDAETRASDRCKEILNNYQRPALDPATDDALQDYVDRRKAGMDDAWY